MQTHPTCKDIISDASARCESLKFDIRLREAELASILQRIATIETLLRSHLINEIIEEQELSVLYKQKQRTKKESRLEQKRRGKNYKEPTLPKRLQSLQPASSHDDTALRKRLYREAMVQVHPDKYANHADTVNIASEVTVRLIDLYRNGTLSELQDYYSYIMSGTALVPHKLKISDDHETHDPEAYLKSEISRIDKMIAETKERHLYKVLEQYPDPMVYLSELKLFYQDRIAKLRKRTRKMFKDAYSD